MENNVKSEQIKLIDIVDINIATEEISKYLRTIREYIKMYNKIDECIDKVQNILETIKHSFISAKKIFEKFGQLSKNDELCLEFFAIRAHLLHLFILDYDGDIRLTNEKEYEKNCSFSYNPTEIKLLGDQISELIIDRNYTIVNFKHSFEQVSARRKLIKEKIIECLTRLNDITNKAIE
jgi:hypothetical protein